MSLVTIILAAGMGKRMNDLTKPKVLFELKGKPMIEYVINRAIDIGSEKIIVIVGFHREKVISFVRERFHNVPNIDFVIQEEQLGTGHAVAQTEPNLKNFHGNIVILSGDVPMLTAKTLKQFQEFHYNSGHTASLISCEFDSPFGYGRIVRDAMGSFRYIQEEKDANDEERAIKEINSGIYIVQCSKLFEALTKTGNDNAGGEYYLTDIFRIFSQMGDTIGAYVTQNPREISGVNTTEQLDKLENIL